MDLNKIVVQEVAVSKALLDWVNPTIVGGMYEQSGYYVMGIDGKFYIDDVITQAMPDTVLALTNNTELNLTPVREKVITFDLGGLKEAEAPVFGVTIDGNFNIQQFNMPLEDIKKDPGLKHLLIAAENVYWGIDGKLHIGDRVYKQDTINNHLTAIKELGYSDPVVLHVDKSVARIYYHDMMMYLYCALGFKKIPMRAISYIDIRYVKAISNSLYQALKAVPANEYYAPQDKEDVSALMLDNYSDKRQILKQYVKKTLPQLNTEAVSMHIDNLTEIIPYFFSGDMASKNEEFVQSVRSHKFPEVCAFEDGHMADTLSISESIFRYLEGYAPICSNDKYEALTQGKVEVADKIDFDPALYPVDTFDYVDYVILKSTTKGKRRMKVREKFGDNVVFKNCPNQLFGMDKFHEFLKPDMKIKVLKEK